MTAIEIAYAALLLLLALHGQLLALWRRRTARDAMWRAAEHRQQALEAARLAMRHGATPAAIAARIGPELARDLFQDADTVVIPRVGDVTAEMPAVPRRRPRPRPTSPNGFAPGRAPTQRDESEGGRSS